MNLKRRWGYEDDTPRCANCRGYQRAKNRLVDGGVVRLPARCRLGKFPVTENGCCDRWNGRDGSTLA